MRAAAGFVRVLFTAAQRQCSLRLVSGATALAALPGGGQYKLYLDELYKVWSMTGPHLGSCLPAMARRRHPPADMSSLVLQIWSSRWGVQRAESRLPARCACAVGVTQRT